MAYNTNSLHSWLLFLILVFHEIGRAGTVVLTTKEDVDGALGRLEASAAMPHVDSLVQSTKIAKKRRILDFWQYKMMYFIYYWLSEVLLQYHLRVQVFSSLRTAVQDYGDGEHANQVEEVA